MNKTQVAAHIQGSIEYALRDKVMPGARSWAPPHEVAARLSELERFLHSDSQLPLLVKIGLAHVQFETMSPVSRWQRTSPIADYVFAVRTGSLAEAGAVPVSYYFKRYRQQYYEQLQAVRDEESWEAWLMFSAVGFLPR